ncbi:Peptidoglycan-binding (PGRP) domain of peptidoglycan hydrolases-containing protein [Lachnospiraceae bacterium KHCPX20]|nr:Peptidoglycan-binding (PGRP) domain of peptidoglycan hydrolases-containing protein [Lachnospiraceae bacterium KHCPX20]
MNTIVSIRNFIATAKKYDGYLEKSSNKNLDSLTGNAGLNNYTRFGRDYDKIMGTHLNGQSWCAMFVSMVAVECFGVAKAKQLLGGNLFAYTPAGATMLGAKARKPIVGDLVFFYSIKMGRISHVGIVTDVGKNYFYTIEGNTSGDPGVIRNGGAVNQKRYPLNYSAARFGTPKWDKLTSKTNIVDKVKAKVTAKSAAAKNPYASPSTTLKVGSRGQSVKWLQWELNQWKADLRVDGDFGSNTDSWVRKFQTTYKLKVNGIVDSKTISALKKN